MVVEHAEAVDIAGFPRLGLSAEVEDGSVLHHPGQVVGPGAAQPVVVVVAGVVVPEGVVAFVLVEADTVAEFGAYLVGVDAGEEGGELADGHTEGVLYTGCSRCFDHRNTPSFPVGIELDGLSRPSQPHALNNWTHGGVGFALVGDDENG